MKNLSTEELIKEAVSGDKLAAESLIRLVQDKIYSLSLRMLWQAEDAEEACQEILLKIMTRLSQFSFQSKFETWAYRIATNHLIDKKRSETATSNLSFSSFEEDLLSEQVEPSRQETQSADFQMQLSEIRLSCTTALLQCLDIEHRTSYILGEIFEMDHIEASAILDISSSSFRKRLERAREQVENFTQRVCGVISEKGTCKCSRRLNYSKSCGRVDFKNYPLTRSSEDKEKTIDFIQKIELAKRTAAHYRRTGSFKSPKDYSKILDMLKIR